jgi:hypothetical protein
MVRVPGYRSRGPGFDSRHYQILWEVVGLERGPLILVSTIEELLETNSSGSGLEIRGDPSRWPRDTPLSAEVGTTSPSSDGRLVGIVRSRTKATEFSPPMASDEASEWWTLAPLSSTWNSFFGQITSSSTIFLNSQMNDVITI